MLQSKYDPVGMLYVVVHDFQIVLFLYIAGFEKKKKDCVHILLLKLQEFGTSYSSHNAFIVWIDSLQDICIDMYLYMVDSSFCTSPLHTNFYLDFC